MAKNDFFPDRLALFSRSMCKYMKKEALMRLFIGAVFFVLVCTLFVGATPYKVVCQNVAINEALSLGKYETVIQAGHNELDRFTMHRVVKLDENYQPLKPCSLKGAFILLPGGSCNFASYLLGPDGESLATYLALKGIDVYGYSPRGRGLVTGFCDSNDCSSMKYWGIATYVKDIEYIRKKAARLHHKRPVVGGLSLGAILSVAAVNKKPNAYAGAVLWEGGLYYGPPTSDLFTDTCAYYKALWESGQYFDNEMYPVMKLMVWLYYFDPNGPSPFAAGMTNWEFFVFFAVSPHDPPDGEAPGYTYAGGDMVNGFYYLDENMILDFAMQMNDYEPVAIFRDYMCGLAGERTFTNRLEIFTGPILSMQAGLGFGYYVEDNLALFGTTDITRYIKPEFGHADFGVPINYVDTICIPIWEWLEQKILPLWEK
jgi:pimeloyl-ACP methyl ester carboxylesterase